MPIRLSFDDTAPFTDILRAAQLVDAGETVVGVESPGAGNMNFVARATTSSDNRFIVKQAREYVEKYPSIPAPVERTQVEASFYGAVQSNEYLQALTPKLLHLDPENSILVLEDLGSASDFTDLYSGAQISPTELRELVSFLSRLHMSFPRAVADVTLENRAMRQLNAEHVFRFPFAHDNGFDLDEVTPGLQAVANTYRDKDRVRKIANELQQIYLGVGDTLIHGDYFPGSWLRTDDGIRVIDPEFAFLGPKEWDLAVMSAHLMMAEQPQSIIDEAYGLDQPVDMFDEAIFAKFTGIEIFRRLIGLAQLPLSLALDEKSRLLDRAFKLLA